jgi:hypothetical protein
VEGRCEYNLANRADFAGRARRYCGVIEEGNNDNYVPCAFDVPCSPY